MKGFMAALESTNPTAARWFTIIAYSVIGAAFATILEPLFASECKSIAMLLKPYGYSSLVILSIILIVPIVAFSSHLGFRLNHIRNLIFYPPTWTAVLLAFIWFEWMKSGTLKTGPRWFGEKYYWVFALAFVALLVISWLAKRKKIAVRNPNKQSHGAIDDLTDAAFVKWSEREEPIENSGADLFELTVAATQIVDQLRTNSSTTIGLVAPFGSGKSSLITLIRNALVNDPIIIVEVSCWGFDDSAKAQQHILSKAIDALSQQVECASLKSLPITYIRSVSSGSSWLDYAFNLMSSNDPSAELRQINPILKSIRMRMLIIVEDIDRTGSTFHRDHLAAMYNRLRSVPNVSFLLASNSFTPFTSDSSSHNSGIDMAKLCDFRFDITLRKQHLTFQILKRARMLALGKFKDDEVRIFDQQGSTNEWATGPMDVLGYRNWIYHLIHIFDSIRSLKACARRFLHTWNRLHGEIDPDDLLIVCAITEVCPQALDLINELVSRFGLNAGDRNFGDRNESKKTAQDVWDRYILSDYRFIQQLKSLVSKLLPHLGDEPIISSDMHRTQSVRVTSPTHYWQRCLNAHIYENELRDQNYLRELNDWKKIRAPDTLEKKLLQDARYGEKLEQFNDHISITLLLDLCGSYFNQLRRTFANTANASMDGFLPLWRSAIRSRRETLADFICREIKLSVPVSARLASDIYYYWGSVEHGLLSPEEKQSVRTEVHLAMQQLISSSKDPLETFQSTLDPSFPYSLLHLIAPPVGSKVVDDVSILQSPNDWTFLANHVLSGLEKSPNIWLPQVVNIISNRRMGSTVFHVNLEEKFSQEFFGEEMEKVFSIVEACGDSVKLEGQPEMNYQISELKVIISARKAKKV